MAAPPTCSWPLAAVLGFILVLSAPQPGYCAELQETEVPEEFGEVPEEFGEVPEELGEVPEEFGEVPEESAEVSKEQLRQFALAADQNGDGKASFQELHDHALHIQQILANQAAKSELEESESGPLTLDQYLADVMGELFDVEEQYLQDGDSGFLAVAKDERTKVEEREAAKFRAADANGDQSLDANELSSLMFPGGHQGVLDFHVRASIADRDSDQDGKLNMKEYHDLPSGVELGEAAQEDFQFLDKNGDGFLDADEIRYAESGRAEIDRALKMVFELADADHDNQVTPKELEEASEHINLSDALHHLLMWTSHPEHEEL